MAMKVAHTDIISVMPAWVAVDGALFVVCSDRRLAARVAELLDRHGIADIPDTIEQFL